MEYGFVVDVNALEGGVEEIAQQAYGSACLFVNEGGVFGHFLHLDHGLFPMFEQDFQFAIKLGNPFALSYRAHDDTEILRLDAHEQLLESGSLFA